MGSLHHAILLNGVEAVEIELFQIGGLEDADVHVAFDKQVVSHPIGAILFILL